MRAEPLAPAARPPGRAELSEILERHGIRPSRALGQNFLADPNTAERIARLGRVGPGDRVVEIGAGLGSLTVALARTGAEVLALEKDRYLLPPLEEMTADLEQVRVVQLDAMKADWPAVLGQDRWVMVSNLPYNVATPLVIDLLRGAPIDRMLVMVQREVGERLVAEPRTKAYGAVSVRVAYHASGRLVGRVPAGVFVPRPKIESALVEITRRPVAAVPSSVASYEEIDRLVGLGFAGRRKMLRRSLAGAVPNEAFAMAGIEPTRRPEELGVEEWGRLADCVRMAGTNRRSP